MRFKLTILLLILNLAIFCLILYVDRHQGSKEEFMSKSRIILDHSFLQSVRNIRISSPRSGVEWHLQLTDAGSWEVSKPIHWKANPYAVQQLMFQMKALSWLQRFPIDSLDQAGQSLQSYDLQDPPLLVSLDNGNSEVSLSFGAPTEIGNRLYMLSPDGDYILVISRDLTATLQQNLDEFLDRRIFGDGMEESRVIQIQDRAVSNVRVRMERTMQDWRFVSPIEAAADTDRVQAMLAQWQTMEGSGFRTPLAEEGKMEGEGLRLTFEGLGSRESISFSMQPAGEGENSHYLARMDGFNTVFQVPANQVNALRRAQEDLREKRILSRHAEDWSSMEILFGDMSTTLQRLENGTWQVLSKNASGELSSQPADASVIQEIRKLLFTLEVVRFVSDAPSETDVARYGLNNPQRRIILRKDGGKSIELSIGGLSREGSESLLYGTTSASASVFLIRPHILSNLPLNPMNYRERTIRTLPDTAVIKKIQLKNQSTGSVVEISDQTNPAAWVRIQAYLRKVEVRRFINPRFADPLQLDEQTSVPWAFLLRAEIQYPEATGGEASERVLYLTERIGGTTQYIGDRETGFVGILPTDMIEILEPLMVSFPENPGSPPGQNKQKVEPES